jgi:hypothetical protein
VRWNDPHLGHRLAGPGCPPCCRRTLKPLISHGQRHSADVAGWPSPPTNVSYEDNARPYRRRMSSLWTALIGFAVIPLYLRYLGIEAYG